MTSRSKAVMFAAAICVVGVALVIACIACGSGSRAVSASSAPVPKLAPARPDELRAPDAFSTIASPEQRSRALFLEASRVMFHPRCVNCHPSGDTPAQGDEGRVHDPPVLRGANDQGVPGLECASCHQDRNLELARVPGAPKWHLAPLSMAWVGRTPRELCEQIKDPARNGGKTLAQILDHSAHDELVAWGWSPGWGRTPAPGTQERFGALMDAWARDGASCPTDEAKR